MFLKDLPKIPLMETKTFDDDGVYGSRCGVPKYHRFDVSGYRFDMILLVIRGGRSESQQKEEAGRLYVRGT